MGKIMRFVSWNVNGIRAILKKDFLPIIESMDADFVCLQETKVTADVLPEIELKYPYKHFHFADKKGYSGTAIFTREEPLSVSREFKSDHEHPQEGRVLTVEMEQFYLVNVYTPNSQGGLARLPYRHGHWDPDFRSYVSGLQKNKPVIICGDLNVAHKEIDLENPEDNHMSAGFSDEERAGFEALLDEGFVDTFRHCHPDAEKKYSWWSYRTRARERNVGWRIDYFLVSEALRGNIREAYIRDDVMGSDHAPVGLVLEL